jgi:hypothetical protein
MPLADLHEAFYGTQDNAFDTFVSQVASGDKSTIQPVGVFKETRTFTFDVKPGDKPIQHILSPGYKKDETFKNEAYTNFKISPVDAVIELQLEVGGQRHESLNLFRFLKTEPQFYQMSEGRYVPALAEHENIIKIITDKNSIHTKSSGYEGPITISYDVLTIESTEEMKQTMIQQEQWGGVWNVPGAGKKYLGQISFNQPVVKIYAFIDADNVSSVKILMNGADKTHIVPLEKTGSYFFIEFGNNTSVNFSRVREALIEVEAEGDIKSVNVFGTVKQLIRILQGMAGAAFSK